MLTRMSDSPSSDLHEPDSADGPGILAGLPRTRPQRASARRLATRVAKPSAEPGAAPSRPSTAPPRRASRRAPATGRGTRGTGERSAPATSRVAGKQRAPAKRGPAAGERAPRQGFEAEPDSLTRPIQPPGGAELVASLAELAGELAKAGVTTGGRVLRDVLSRLPPG